MRPHSTGALSAEQHAAQDARYAEGHQYDYVFVGSGNAALTCAALLAKAGHRVCVLEAHDVPGGYAQTFKYGAYSFCAQVHYVWGCGPGGAIHQLVHALGLQDEITFELYDAQGYDRVATPDGKISKIPYGLANAADSIAANYPEQREPLRAFFRTVATCFDQLERLPASLEWHHYLTAPFTLGSVIEHRNHTLQQVFDAHRLSREVQAVLCGNAGDFLLPPNRLSFLLYCALMGSYSMGAYYPTRHFQHYVERLTQSITDTKGCHAYFETRVKRFAVDGGRLRSVTTEDGKTFTAAKGVICNMDPQRAAGLIGLQHFPADYRRQLEYEYSDSALIIYLGLQGVDLRAHGFGRHNTWRVTQWDMNQAWREQNDDDNHQNPWLFISTPTLLTPDESHAPPGGQIMELATSLSYRRAKALKDHDARDYRAHKRRVAERLLDLVEQHHVPNLRRHIKVRLVGTPTTNDDFVGAPMGNAYGASLTPQNVRHRLPFETPITGLYWCNATAGYPGLCGTTTAGLSLYEALTGHDVRARGPHREQREAMAIAADRARVSPRVARTG